MSIDREMLEEKSACAGREAKERLQREDRLGDVRSLDGAVVEFRG